MSDRKSNKLSPLGVLVMGALAVMAQSNVARADDSGASTKLDKIEVTGSLIKRTIDDEGALPVTIIKTEDLERTGVTTIEQAMANIAANQNTQNINNNVGASTGGQSTVSLRGLGAEYTLVLLNGQRIANFAYAPGSADINGIPLAAIDRIEVLKDGASAVYGTDAIGGVINFITKKNYHGFTVSADQANPEKNGGTINHFTATGGFGDLDKEGFNVLGSYNLQRQKPVSTSDRGYALTAASTKFSSYSNPANYYQNSSGISYNPALPTCAPPNTFPDLGSGRCNFAYATYVDLVPYNSSDSTFLKAQFKLPGDNIAGLEYFRTEHHVTTHVAPDVHALLLSQTLANGNANPYFPGGAAGVPLPPGSLGAFDTNPATSALSLRWRVTPTGDRVDVTHSTEDRIAATLKGTLLSDVDYSAAIFVSHSRAGQGFGSGYDNDAALQDLLDGTNNAGLNPNGIVVNPFGANNATQLGALQATQVTSADVITAGTQNRGVNAQFSREFGALPGGPFALSAGAEYKQESFVYSVNDPLATITVNSSGIAPGSSVPQVSRNSSAIYLEALAPITKELEADVAVRTDRYDGFGTTTNPKFSIRYQPMRELLVRGSAATGFRAPDLYQLYAPNSVTNTAGQYNDPNLCPNGVPINGSVNPNISCNQQQYLLNKGNAALKPERSRSYTLGLVFQPTNKVKATVDFFDVDIRDQVRTFGEGALYNNYAQFSSQYVTCANAPASLAASSGACGAGANPNNLAYVINPLANVGEIKTRGLDFGLQYATTNAFGAWNLGVDATYTNRFDYQLNATSGFTSNVGVYSTDLVQTIFRWQATSAIGWKKGDWAADLVNHFKSGYTDSNPSHHVPQYFLWDSGVTYSGVKNLTISLAVRNLLDANPPFSNQTGSFQVGYDPANADPLGRVYYLGLKYSFK